MTPSETSRTDRRAGWWREWRATWAYKPRVISFLSRVLVRIGARLGIPAAVRRELAHPPQADWLEARASQAGDGMDAVHQPMRRLSPPVCRPPPATCTRTRGPSRPRWESWRRRSPAHTRSRRGLLRRVAFPTRNAQLAPYFPGGRSRGGSGLAPRALIIHFSSDPLPQCGLLLGGDLPELHRMSPSVDS